MMGGRRVNRSLFLPENAFVKVKNRTRGTILGDHVRAASSFLPRLAGLLGTSNLPSGGGVWIAPCRCVHTFGMRYPVDVAFVGPGDVVVGVSPVLLPNRASRFWPDARGALELPAGTLAVTGTTAGDRLEFQTVPVPLTPAVAGW
jgi:uncharacterized membrane protein (UPF0127 family)